MAALALYIISLGTSAGLLGVFARQMLGELEYVAGFHMEIILASGVACAYLGVQLAYVAFLRVLFPTKAPGLLFAETLSHLAALIFVPYLLHVRMPWPHPMLLKVEPLLYLGLFGATHAFLKMASFYAALRGKPAGRLGSLGWMAVAGVCGVGGYVLLNAWLNESAQGRPIAPESVAAYRVGDAFASARAIPEGAVVTLPMSVSSGACVAMRWANVPALTDNVEPLKKIYATVAFEGGESVSEVCTVSLNDTGWAELQIPAEHLPDNVRTCTVMWSARKEPEWQKYLPVRPVVHSNREMLLSGPFQHEQRADATAPNFVVVVVEGLGAAHMSALGYKRDTTPALNRLARSALIFTHAYTPAPEVTAACMTLLTGTGPLRHGYLGRYQGPLPKGDETLAEVLQRNHYTTQAFTEGGDSEGDLAFGSGFERGFEMFDPSYAGEAQGSASTLQKAAAWIDAHVASKYFVFVRLRELRDLHWSARYAPGFVTDAKSPAPVEVYDSGILYLDRLIGEFVKHVRATEAGKNTCVVITSTHGFDFSTGDPSQPATKLTEGSLHVPLLVYLPTLKKVERTHFVGLEDVTPTLLALAQTGLDYTIDGRDVIQDSRDRWPISMFGDPLVMSYRVDRWRFVWQSGLSPFTRTRLGAESVIELCNVVQAQKTGYVRNDMAKNPDLCTRYRSRLESYFNEQAPPGKR